MLLTSLIDTFPKESLRKKREKFVPCTIAMNGYIHDPLNTGPRRPARPPPTPRQQRASAPGRGSRCLQRGQVGAPVPPALPSGQVEKFKCPGKSVIHLTQHILDLMNI